MKKKPPKDLDLSPEDEACLDDFCAGIEIDDIKFDEWQETHKSTDLSVEVWLEVGDRSQPIRKSVSYCRSISIDGPDGTIRQMEQLTCSIDIPPGACDGDVIVVEDFGDIRGSRKGNLKVIVRIKGSPR